MKGFKSFPERVSLEFSPGVSVIVGPNGSGKSNITDAVLWALGEQSPGAIRGASMQDVISAGGKNTAPAARGPGRGRDRQLRRAGGDRVLRDRGGAAARPLRRRRLPAERGAGAARRRHRGPLRHQPRARDALGDQPGPGGDDHPLQTARAAAPDRGGGGPRQAPQTAAAGRTEAARDARQPRPGARRRARGAGAAAAAETPGAGGRDRRADRARGNGAEGADRLRGAALRRRPGGRGGEGGGGGAGQRAASSRSSWPR